MSAPAHTPEVQTFNNEAVTNSMQRATGSLSLGLASGEASPSQCRESRENRNSTAAPTPHGPACLPAFSSTILSFSQVKKNCNKADRMYGFRFYVVFCGFSAVSHTVVRSRPFPCRVKYRYTKGTRTLKPHWVISPIQIFGQVNSIHIYCGIFTPESALDDSGT
jgi:hypothetical protein